MEPLDRVLLGAAAVGGGVCAVGAVMYLYLYAGPVPIPLSAILFGALLAGISVAARRLGDRPFHGALPVIAFVLVTAAFMAGGPGGDIMLYADWRLLLLLVCGIGMPALARYLASSSK